MKILELNIRNLRKISAIDITPKDNVISIEGKNGQGKSTVLDSILFALAGGKIPDGVVKNGEDKAVITVKVDDYVIKKTITDSGNYLTIESNGMIKSNPQKFLSSLVGKIAFDPLEFMRYDDKKQSEVLRKVLGIEDKINDLKSREVLEMENRKELKKDLDKIAVLIGNKIFDKIDRPEDSGELVSKIQKNSEERDRLMDTLRDLAQLKSNDEKYAREIADLEKALKEVTLAREKNKLRINESDEQRLRKDLATVDFDFQRLKENLSSHEEQSKKYAEYEKFVENNSKYEITKEEYSDSDKKVNKIRNEIEDTLSNSEMPIEGLELKEDGIYYDKTSMPNTCESLKLKIAVALSMKMNPELKVILIRDGSLLDNESIEEIRSLAKSEDFQVWIEKVSNEKDDDGSIFIEEGGIE